MSGLGKNVRCLAIAVVQGSFVLSAATSEVRADQFHYANLLQGPRAQGLGGAFVAVADDASGIVYNPAGLAFALSNDISGSANAFYSRKAVYKNTIGSDNFEETSGGSVPTFFGVLQKLDKYVPGLVGAFGNYFTDSDLKDQDDLITNKMLGENQLRRFHRSAINRSSTNYWSGAVGYRATANLAVGFGLGYFNVDELTQDYQDVKLATKIGDDPFWLHRGRSTVSRLEVFGIEPILGFQYVIGTRFSLGLTIKYGVIVSQSYKLDVEERRAYVPDDRLTDLEGGTRVAAFTEETVISDDSDEPMDSWPANVRFGGAWFPTTRLMLTGDVSYHTSTEDKNKIGFKREEVINYALGVEYYAMPAIPLRFGLFTNNDARPEIDETKAGQPDHIDYIGESLFIAWVQPNSQVAVGVVLQQGEGKAQKLGNQVVQDVEADSQTYAFSATHNF